MTFPGIDKEQSDKVVIQKGNKITFSIVIQGIEDTTKVKNKVIIIVIDMPAFYLNYS